MGKNTTTPQTIKQPKRVLMSTYLQSLAIAVLVTGILATVGGYFIAINVYGDARSQVSSDIVKLSKVSR